MFILLPYLDAQSKNLRSLLSVQHQPEHEQSTGPT